MKFIPGRPKLLSHLRSGRNCIEINSMLIALQSWFNLFPLRACVRSYARLWAILYPVMVRSFIENFFRCHFDCCLHILSSSSSLSPAKIRLSFLFFIFCRSTSNSSFYVHFVRYAHNVCVFSLILFLWMCKMHENFRMRQELVTNAKCSVYSLKFEVFILFWFEK